MTKTIEGMKLHQGVGPNSYRVRIFLAEKDLAVPLVGVDFSKGDHRSPEFLKLNSLGQIPVLEFDDGTIITESVAICRYFEARHPENPLFGSDPLDIGRIEMWNRRVEMEVFGTIGSVALHTNEFFKDRLTQFPAFGETQRMAVPGKWAWLDGEMADGRPFIAGETFSMADIHGMVSSWLGEVFEMPIPPGLKHVGAWNDRVRARPSWNA